MLIEQHRVRAGVYRALCQADPAGPALKAMELAVLLGFQVVLIQRALDELRVVGFVIELVEQAGWAITPDGLDAYHRPLLDMGVVADETPDDRSVA